MTIQVQYPEGTSTCVASVFGHASAKVSYAAPVITAMHDHVGMPTNGTTSVTIDGANFGPHASYNVLAARYGKTGRSEEHTSELQSLMRISYAVLCLKKKKTYKHSKQINYQL